MSHAMYEDFFQAIQLNIGIWCGLFSIQIQRFVLVFCFAKNGGIVDHHCL